MNNLQIINTDNFKGISCDVYSDGNRIYMTRNQIGQALKYNCPSDSIELIHRRHKDRLNKFSVTVKLTGTDGKCYNTIVYSQRGIMEICRWSRQKLADQFMDWVWDIIETYRDGTIISNIPTYTEPILTETQVSHMIDERLSQFKSEFKKEMLSLPEPKTKSITRNIKTPIIQSTEDIIRKTIEPLAKSLHDTSKGYNSTYRKVYEAMGVSWIHRQSRYRNQHNNKNKPSKFNLISNDQKLLQLFVKTVEKLNSEFEEFKRNNPQFNL